MGNYTEFRRVAKLVSNMIDFDIDINASVFETNIRSKCSHCSIVFEGALVLPDQLGSNIAYSIMKES